MAAISAMLHADRHRSRPLAIFATMNAFEKHRLAAAIISYHPPLELAGRLQLLREAGMQVYLWENSETPAEAVQWANEVLNQGAANAGLGPSLSLLLDHARTAGYEKLLYFDQDTSFTAESLAFIANFLEAGYYTAEFAAIRFAEAAHSLAGKTQPQKQRLLLSSGMLFQLSAPVRHDPSFFVEGVDYQYCLDAAIKGWKLGLVGCTGIGHESVQPEQVFRLGSYEMAYRPYPTRRHIELTKAYLRLWWRAIRHWQPSYILRFWKFLFNHWRVQFVALPFRLLCRLGLAKSTFKE